MRSNNIDVKVFICIIVFLLIIKNINAQLVINEIFLTNGSADLITPDYNYVNWIELYNSSNTVLSTTGMYLSDDSTQLKKWELVTTSIAPKGFLIIYVDGTNIGWHTNFKPNAEGGTLFLSKGNKIIDRFSYGTQAYNISYGRIPDGSSTFYYFYTPSRKKSNITSTILTNATYTPIPNLKGGYYNNSITVSLSGYSRNATVYYTTDGSEPTEFSKVYKEPIRITSTTVLRARAFEYNKIPSQIITETYFINERKPLMPVVSLTTDPKNLTDNTLGIYVVGTNGIEGNCYGRANWNRDWERAANFEFFDKNHLKILNQMVGIKIAGACSRTLPQKSLTIHARSKYGKGRLNYPFFKDRTYTEFNSIFLRNGGNDWNNTLFRDGIFQELTDRNMNLDHQEFQPAVLFINGQYYGVQTIYERSGPDLVEAKYGLTDDKIDMVDVFGRIIAGSNTDYNNLISFVTNNSLSNAANFKYVADRIDMDEYIDYLIFQIYIGNHDWPGNNIKIWRPKNPTGKWRWIVYDTDFGFGLYSNVNHETVRMIFDTTTAQDWPNPLWSTILPRKLIENTKFKQKFLNRFYAHINSTFKPEHVIKTIDSVTDLYKSEMPNHCKRWGLDYNSWQNNINNLKTAAQQRPGIVRQQLRDWFGLNADVDVEYHNLSSTKGKIAFDNIESVDTSYYGTFPLGTITVVRFIPPTGYKFKYAIRKLDSSYDQYIIKSGDNWKYWDQGQGIDPDWYLPDYQINDSMWKEGPSQLGYGDGDEKTVLSYGNDANNKYVTTYFRKTFNFDTSKNWTNLTLRILYDDGAVVYINGTKWNAINFSDTSNIDYSTFANGAPDETSFFEFPLDISYLKSGENTIAVEIHQSNSTSSDISFDLEIIGEIAGNKSTQIISSPEYIDTLSGNIEYWAEYEPTKINNSLVINEITHNNNVIADEFGEYDPWIELYNNSRDSLQLCNYFFTDSLEKPAKYQISKWYQNVTIIPPFAYKLLWIDGQSFQGPFHLPFDLKENRLFAVYQKIGNEFQLIDSIKISNKYGPYSIVRYPDVTGIYCFPAIPTPLSKNNECINIRTDLKIERDEEFIEIKYVNDIKELQIGIKNIDAINYILRIIDINGRILSTYQFKHTISINLCNLQNGLYIAEIIAAKKCMRYKFIVNY